MQWNTPNEKFVQAIPSDWLDATYYDALNALFRSENALRLLVFVVLKNALKDKWDTPNLESDETASGTIASIAKRRRSQDRDYGYLGYDVACPLMYLTAGELTRLVLSNTFWSHFKAYFSASKSVVEAKLSEISNIRNRFAHFRPLRPEDAAQVRINATQVLSTAETMLRNMLDSRDPVPSNCDEGWYRHLSNISSKCVTLRFFQSADLAWIRVVLDCECATLADASFLNMANERRGRTTTVVSPEIYVRFPALQSHSTCMTEDTIGSWKEDDRPPVRKLVRLLFHRQSLAAAHEEVAANLKECFELLDCERELLVQDNLAHGKIVKPVKFAASRVVHNNKTLSRWDLNLNDMLVPVAPNHPPEYWGTFGNGGGLADFFTDTRNYPWMPTPVSSEEDIPF